MDGKRKGIHIFCYPPANLTDSNSIDWTDDWLVLGSWLKPR